MKTWKLVSGILSLAFSLFILFQSCAANFVAAWEEKNDDTSAAGGFLVALMLIAGGIVSIVTRKSTKNSGNTALIILFGLGALIGYANLGIYSDLLFWSTWALACAILAIVSFVKNKKRTTIEITKEGSEL